MSQTVALTGTMTTDGVGGITIALTGSSGGTTPPPTNPPPTNPPPTLPPPVDTRVLTPTGGDDTGAIQGALNDLPSGHALMLSGMFQVSNTLWLDGYQKRMIGDPAKPSGIRAMNSGMNGHYGALLCTKPSASHCAVQGLEFDAQGKQTELIFIDGGNTNIIDNCYLHDIAYNPSGAPYAAIHSQNVTDLVISRNRIERTTGIDGGEGVRGIWIVGAKGLVIVGNKVKDTGHTCIIGEGASVVIVGNQCGNSLTQGTGIKLCYRPMNDYQSRTQHGFTVAKNSINTTMGAGLMLQDVGEIPGGVLVESNDFINCGKQGTSFGAIYSSNDANNVIFRGNKVENCRSVAGLRHARNWLFENSNIVGGSNVVWLEDSCSGITLDRSGTANVGSNCSNVTVDGNKVA